MSEQTAAKKPNEHSSFSGGAKKARVEWIDILRGAMMFFVVWGHSSARSDVERWIFSFHMPVFFIISGMTFAFNKEWDAAKYLVKKIKGLLLPYLLLNIYVTPIYYLNALNGKTKMVSPLKLIEGIFISNGDYGFPMPSMTTWFITCLFLTDLIFFALRRLIKNDVGLSISVILGSPILYTFLFSKMKGGGVWHWQTAFTAVFFYLLGYLFMKNYDRIKPVILKIKPVTVLISFVFIILGYFVSEKQGRVSMVNDSYKNVLLFFLSAALTSFAAAFLVIVICENKSLRKILEPINFIGKNTLVYLAFHVPIIKILKFYTFCGQKSEPKRILMAVIIYVGLIPIAWLVSKALPNRAKRK